MCHNTTFLFVRSTLHSNGSGLFWLLKGGCQCAAAPQVVLLSYIVVWTGEFFFCCACICFWKFCCSTAKPVLQLDRSCPTPAFMRHVITRCVLFYFLAMVPGALFSYNLKLTYFVILLWDRCIGLKHFIVSWSGRMLNMVAALSVLGGKITDRTGWKPVFWWLHYIFKMGGLVTWLVRNQ